MRVAEVYVSKQGEGRLTGVDSVFLRVSGCNLRCWFCDTPFTSWTPEGDDLALEEVVELVTGHPVEHVVITGGEPMLFAEMVPLTESLRDAGRHVTIETAGTLYLPVACDLVSISPKLANSTPSVQQAGRWSARHERARQSQPIVQRLIDTYDHQLKFVVGTPADAADALRYVTGLSHCRLDRVLLMPMGTDTATLRAIDAWLVPFCREHGVGHCPRRHIEWYGHARGT